MGCIVYEMACLQLPFQAKDMESLFRRVVKGNQIVGFLSILGEYRPITR